MSNAESRNNSDGRITVLIAGEIVMTQVVCPISNGRNGDAVKSSPGVSDRMTFAGAMTIASGNGNSANSICDKCAA